MTQISDAKLKLTSEMSGVQFKEIGNCQLACHLSGNEGVSKAI